MKIYIKVNILIKIISNTKNSFKGVNIKLFNLQLPKKYVNIINIYAK